MVLTLLYLLSFAYVVYIPIYLFNLLKVFSNYIPNIFYIYCLNFLLHVLQLSIYTYLFDLLYTPVVSLFISLVFLKCFLWFYFVCFASFYTPCLLTLSFTVSILSFHFISSFPCCIVDCFTSLLNSANSYFILLP